LAPDTASAIGHPGGLGNRPLRRPRSDIVAQRQPVRYSGPVSARWGLPRALDRSAGKGSAGSHPVHDVARRHDCADHGAFGSPSANPFEQSRRYQQIGREALHDEIKIASLAKAWATGIFINLVSPAHLLSPPVALLPRAGFYGTPGNSFFEKAANFAFHSGNATYTWLLILGSCGLAALRVIQLIGAWALVRQRRNWSKITFAGSWIVFLLLLNGPIASPKYRLPLEPLFDIMTGAGVLSLVRLRGGKPAYANSSRSAA
jgi:hypothetical protein